VWSPWKASWLGGAVIGVVTIAHAAHGLPAARFATLSDAALTFGVGLFMALALTSASAASLRCGFYFAKCRRVSNGSTWLLSGVLCVVVGLFASMPSFASATQEVVGAVTVILAIPATLAYAIGRIERDPQGAS
jgi:hypothetical protein